jgi:hypothetical protein
MELSEYVINFEKRNAIKSQVLADFVAEWTEPRSVIEGKEPETPWVVYCDGAWGGNRGRSSSHTIFIFGNLVALRSKDVVL